MLLSRDASQLVLVDLQERLAPAIHEFWAIVDQVSKLIEAAATLGVPIVVSEQYVAGLGPTVEPLRSALRENAKFEKTSFSCMGDSGLGDHIARAAQAGRSQVVLVGIEAHVCVLQTALDLRSAGYNPVVVTDAVGSRRSVSADAAKARLASAGVQLVTTEMVLFEWLSRAGTPEFRALRHLLK